MGAPVVGQQVTTPPATAPRRRAWRGPALTAGIVLAGTAVVALRDPHVSGSYGYCPLYAAAGLFCPACGGLRATHDLAHGDLAAAWAMNPLWVALVPVVVALWGWWAVRVARGRTAPVLPSWSAWVFLALLLVFGVLRNLPGLEALAP
ncbi:DUF2752 domain-containing protein [Cellulomonas palmilytica]|uniref:DUF2752 domain-containing protein n=1 Tax=Cellulomonas palmilytica TaxID=2608402 RepID=UPI001F482D63|nr:DUF2752 domain-containing protein [Cellulomonas palmilytica]UJP38922.1 DUF2752 domain-containing protein [Cellulomonas palmilytica]